MNKITTSDLAFLEWSKRVNSQYPDILEHMRKSTGSLERAITKRIMQIAGGSEE